jgi:uncharacterized membrane protein
MKKHFKGHNQPSVQNIQSFLKTQGIQGKFFSGPLPPASELEHYERIKAGLAERIVLMAERQLTMAEEQMKHRHALENKVINTGVRLSYLGLASGFFLGLSGLAAAVYLIQQGKELGGAAAFIGSLATLAGLFIYGKRKQESDLEKRRSGQ